ncbi:Protein of unknown function [Pseudomonas cedrina]|uniref:DUF1120 domain-containing protein n=2 Tax=Pseudomonas cedrina TaxID=651740 RepID=A0A1V2KBX5_PSECE|nr:DUF1120 domain-containing protein [Pseudomonas cedrina]ONH55212.1 hypothetical protein BLL36_09935 [Pseudomonas cedrina subsp. cedrina]SDR89897.1 Protein of unknown function [Pseudomonas cedrina]
MGRFNLRGHACGLLLLLAPHAFAASSVDLTVTGLIVPSACTPTLSQGGVVDYGRLAAKDLNADSSTWMPTVTLRLSVNCSGPTLFALRGRDNREGTAHNDDDEKYGLGLINGNQRLGSYLLTVHAPVSAGLTLYTLMSLDDGQSWWQFPDGTWLSPAQMTAFGNAESGRPAPVALQTVTSELRVDTAIAPASGLTLTEEVALDGSATVDLFYL